MSRCPHARSEYEIRKLPYCPQCNHQMMSVLVCYEDRNRTIEEWECPYCGLIIEKKPEDEVVYKSEDVLHRRLSNGRERRKKKKSSKGLMRCSYRG